jgi:hypothetical protein
MKHRFNDLPRVVRERLVAITQSNGKDPRLLHTATGWGMGWFRWLMAIGALVAIGACMQFLWERHSDHVHPRHDQEVFAGLAAATFVFTVAAVGILYTRLWPPPPYKEGLFAFRSGLLQTDGGWVTFTPAGELPRPTLVTVRRNGSYSHSRLEFGGPFSFHFSSNAAAEKVCDDILTGKAQMLAMLAARDTAAITAIDPFAECTLSGQWTAPPSAMAIEGPTAAIIPGVAYAVQWLGGVFLGAVAAGCMYAMFTFTFRPGAF